MNEKKLIESINGQSGAGLLESLYGPEAVQHERQRFISLVEGMSPQAGFPEEFSAGGSDLRVFSAPGRTELGGNHTDHNRGRVLAAAIQMDVAAVAVPRTDRKVFFRSAGFRDVVVNLDDQNGSLDLAPKPEEQDSCRSLVRGIAAGFAARGAKIGGFAANGASAVYKGSGLSSSAAVEVLFAKIFDNLYNGGQCSAVELAQIGQQAENNYYGKPCGLMDQAASASGGAVAIDFADPSSPIVAQIEFDPLASGYALCVVNTYGSHSDLTPDYAAIPSEMKAVAACFGKKFLRETDLAQVLSGAAKIREAAGDRALLRAIHFFNEDRRASEMAMLLQRLHAAHELPAKKEIMERFLDVVNESGDSSWQLLQNIYPPREPLVQGIALSLAVSKEFFRGHGIKAACRVHGGGFAGTMQAYVPVEYLDRYRAQMEALFGAGALTVLRIRPAGAVELVFG